ncbi:HlyD family efflux transporter periplasmic adaptor subunit [bacterium]|nr:HlyD family efflux transporter periplasmic adaptor subunit [bacterium]
MRIFTAGDIHGDSSLAEKLAEKNRYDREYEKSRASDSLSEMQVAQALGMQASARLDLIKYRLAKAEIKAPYDCIVAEGDLKEKIGSPVKQGDVLFKVARTDDIYAELEVAESDIFYARKALEGNIAFASRPQDKFNIKVDRIEPVAAPKDKGNVFIVHCSFPDGARDWWRPGMTGVGKLNTTKKTFLWILMHRTMDFLRLKLWW